MTSVKDRARRFLAQLSDIAVDLPFSITLLRDLFALTENGDGVDLRDLAEHIERDQTLAARVLKPANSTFYGMSGKVNSVERALFVLGLKEVRNLVLVSAAQALTQKRRLPADFNLAGYWTHGLRVQAGTALIGGKLGLPKDPLSAAALFHDFGRLLIALYSPEEHLVLAALREAEPETFPHVLEDRYWGVEHGPAGAMALSAWNFPEEISAVVDWHHAPHLAEGHAVNARIVGLADALDHLSQGDAPPYLAVLEDNAAALGLDPSALPREFEARLDAERLNDFAQSLVG